MCLCSFVSQGFLFLSSQGKDKIQGLKYWWQEKLCYFSTLLKFMCVLCVFYFYITVLSYYSNATFINVNQLHIYVAFCIKLLDCFAISIKMADFSYFQKLKNVIFFNSLRFKRNKKRCKRYSVEPLWQFCNTYKDLYRFFPVSALRSKIEKCRIFEPFVIQIE